MRSGPRGRFRVDGGALCDDQVRIDAAEARHARVMRLRAGDRVVLFDGAGEEAIARLEAVAVSGITAQVLERYTPTTESPLKVWLVQAVPTKLARMDLIVRQCTELGMTNLLPVVTARSQVPAGGAEVVAERRQRWVRLAQAAAKQSRRSVVPNIDRPLPFADIDWSSIPAFRLLCDPSGVHGTLAETLRGRAPTSLALLIGPEGGWDAEERALADTENAATVAFGPRVLRADTAGAAALAVLQHAWGDLG